MSRIAAGVLWVLLAGAAHCAPFADPTRPPAAIEHDGLPSDSPGAPRLESVLIAPDRRVAVISGQQVTVGGKVGGGEVVRITESEVVIRGAERLETLKLFPELKRPQPLPEKRTP
jgi:MSHA biogenesis protein MshK